MSYAGHIVEEFLPTHAPPRMLETVEVTKARPIAPNDVEVDLAKAADRLHGLSCCLEDLWPADD